MDGTLALPPPGCETFGKFLCLSFHICEVGVLRALLHQGCWEEYVMLAKDERSSRLAVINPHWGPITDLHSLSPQDPIPRGDQGPAVLIARTNTYTGNSEASECLHPPLHPPRLHPPRLGSLLDRPFPLKQQIQSRSTTPGKQALTFATGHVSRTNWEQPPRCPSAGDSQSLAHSRGGRLRQ